MIFIYILCCISVLMILLVISCKLTLLWEKDKFAANGKMVEIDGGNMHVYAEGKRRGGKPAIVVMSGSSIPSPVYNYKKLYCRFSEAYRVVVPEKFGYGYSDIGSSPRDVETILEQTRKALQLAGEYAPYILMPHSMSGIEAQLWALKYPEEVQAIIGLDMALPSHYENMFAGSRMKYYKFFTTIVRHLGLQRFSIVQKAAGVYDANVLTRTEWQQEKYLIHKMTFNSMIYEEAAAILASATLVKNIGVPKTPMLLFVSDGTVGKGWIDHYKKYISIAPNAEMIELKCGHMMHNYCAEVIAGTAMEYIEKSG